MYSLIETARLNVINPEAYRTDILTRIADRPAKRVAELLPWNWQPANPTAPPPEPASIHQIPIAVA